MRPSGDGAVELSQAHAALKVFSRRYSQLDRLLEAFKAEDRSFVPLDHWTDLVPVRTTEIT